MDFEPTGYRIGGDWHFQTDYVDSENCLSKPTSWQAFCGPNFQVSIIIVNTRCGHLNHIEMYGSSGLGVVRS